MCMPYCHIDGFWYSDRARVSGITSIREGETLDGVGDPKQQDHLHRGIYISVRVAVSWLIWYKQAFKDITTIPIEL